MHSATLWQLRNDIGPWRLDERIAALRNARRVLEPSIGEKVAPFTRERLDERAHALFKAGAPEGLARRIAWLNIAELIPDIALLASEANADLERAAEAFFAITTAFRIGRVADAARSIQPSDYYDGLALSRAVETIGAARRGMAVTALSQFAGEGDPVEVWLTSGGERVERARERLSALTDGGELTVSRLTVAAGLMSDLR